MKKNYLLHFSLFMAMLLLPRAAWGQTVQSLDISRGSITITSTGYTIGDDHEQNYTGDYVISGTTTSYTVTVSSGTHNITLNGASIDVSATDDACAFSIAADAQVNLTLTGENVLTSGGSKAALNVPANATLIIMEGSSGSLVANGGYKGAGIGGDNNQSAGVITINGGTIIATGGGYGGAGIGSGFNQGGQPKGGDITINRGMVTAKVSDSRAAGIGGGAACSGKTITITGGTVIADGIGSGTWSYDQKFDSGTILISGGTVTTSFIGGQNSTDFSTGDTGCAVILANKFKNISDSDRSAWKGVVFENTSGKVYGNPTIKTDAEIPSGETLIIENGHTLSVETETNLTIKGTLVVNEGATLQNNGTMINEGILTNNGTVKGNKITPSLKLSASSGNTPYKGNDLTFTYTYNGDGTVSATSSDGSVATASVSENTVTVTPAKAGSATITVSAAEGSL